MRIAVVGAGAMGSLFGGRLAEAGREVILVDVNCAHIAAINQAGLLLEDDAGSRRIRLRAGLAADFEGAVDLLLVFTKGPQTAAALASVAHLVGPESWALTLQNGLGAGERVARSLPGVPTAVGVTNWPADLKGPGHVSSHGAGEVRLWSSSGAAEPRVEQIAAALAEAGLAARADPEAPVAIWEKVIFNAVMNPVAALTRQTVGGMAAHPEGRLLAEAVLGEAFAVAAAAGAAVDEARVRAAVDHAYREHGPHMPSMLQDVLAGRPTEIDSISGALVEEARRHGVAAPTLEALTRLVRMIRPGA